MKKIDPAVAKATQPTLKTMMGKLADTGLYI